MTRGEIWTVAGGPEFTGKPRPAVILQDDVFDATSSVTVCPVTSSDTEARSARPAIEASAANGLQVASRLMVDKITTVSRAKLHRRIGRLSSDDVTKMGRAVVVFLGLGSGGGSRASS